MAKTREKLEATTGQVRRPSVKQLIDEFGLNPESMSQTERMSAISGYDVRHRIEAMVAGVTARKIKHVYKGDGAATAPGFMILPRIPATHLFPIRHVRVLLGYTAHEISHQLLTDFGLLQTMIDDATRENRQKQQIKEFWNAIEDYRIEKIAPREYPGFHVYIDDTRDFSAGRFCDRVGDGVHDPKALSNPYRIGAVGLTWIGAELNSYRTTRPREALNLLDPQLRAWLESWRSDMKAVETCADARDLAIVIVEELDRLRTQQPESDEQQGGPQRQQQAGGDGSQQQGGSSGQQQSSPSPPASDQSQSGSKPDKQNGDGPDNDQSNAPGASTDASGDGQEADGGQDSAAGEGKSSNQSADAGQDADIGNEPGNDADATDGGETGTGSDQQEDTDGKPTSDDGDDAVDTPDDGGAADAKDDDASGKDANDKAGAGKADVNQEAGDAGKRPDLDVSEGDEEAAAEAADLEIDDLSRAIRSFKGPEAVDPQVKDGDELSALSRGSSGGSAEEIIQQAVARGQQAYTAMRQNIAGSAARSAGILRRMLMAQRRRTWRGGHEEGELDFGRLVPMVQGNPDIYRQRIERTGVNTALSLLLDNSGSMRGNPIRVCQETAVVLDMAIQGTPTKIEITGFTGTAPQPVLYRYRSFGQTGQAASASLGNMDQVTLGGTPVSTPLLECWRRLMQQKEPRRIMIVVSDGGADYNDVEASRQAHDFIVRQGCTVIGIAIGCVDEMQAWCDNCQAIDSIDDLPIALTKLVQETMR